MEMYGLSCGNWLTSKLLTVDDYRRDLSHIEEQHFRRTEFFYKHYRPINAILVIAEM